MEVNYAARRQIAAFLLIAFSLSSNLFFSLKTLKSARGPTGRDDIGGIEQRLEGVKRLLPRYGVVGYTSDRAVQMDDQSWHELANEEAWRECRRVQYALSPLLIDLSDAHPLVIGSFRDPSAARANLARSRLVRLQDFNNGIVLLAGTEK
jgi:hypothetical protein